ncbi:MAG TPA: hypothetical protein VG711_04950 [Phycisphaerales bacterium]|nr:hypothetical protein [Phycisphaerales bacterium]
MLLTLSAGSFRSRLSRNGSGGMRVVDLPTFTIRELKLHGLNIPVSLLKGWSTDQLEQLRDAADKASCPCLVLIEDTPLVMGSTDPQIKSKTSDRVKTLALAANKLGCNSLALKIDAPDSKESFDRVVIEIKSLMPSIEKRELNALIAPGKGLTESTERLTELIKKVGGFRIGSLPSFGDAARVGEGDPVEALRKLAPYAGSIQATVEGFNKKGAHKSYDLAACVSAIRNVGFLNTLAIDYTGDDDELKGIAQAREILQAAIDAQES